MPGSHWLAYIYVNHTKNLIYDSFGRKHKSLLSHVKFDKQILEPEYDPEQNDLEENCGQRCIAFCLFYDIFGLENALKI